MVSRVFAAGGIFLREMAASRVPRAMGRELYRNREVPVGLFVHSGFHGTRLKELGEQADLGVLEPRGRIYIASRVDGRHGAVKYAGNNDDSVIVTVVTERGIDIDLISWYRFIPHDPPADESPAEGPPVHIAAIHEVSPEWRDRVYGARASLPASLPSRVWGAFSAAIGSLFT